MNTHLVQLLFVDLALVLVVARGFGHLAARVRQPPVVGEIVAGVLLGSALLWAPLGDEIFPANVRSLLSGLASVGLAWFMFAVGLEVKPATLRARARSVASVAAWSTLAAFGLGALVAVVLMRRHPADDPLTFIVFFGLAMSVTAFPVLARILRDRGLITGEVGELSLAVAALADVVAWLVLALLLAWSGGSASWTTGLLVPYIAVMVLVVRPLARWLLGAEGARGADDTHTARAHALLFGLALLSAAATEAIGVHFIFGAFLAGVVVGAGAGERQSHALEERAEKATSMLLPVYFVLAGLGIDFVGLRLADLAEGLLILAVAIIGKAGGSYIGGRRYGLGRRDAGLLATLLNTRGLTELIILGVGYNAGILDQPLYSILVCVAIITTVLTGPLVSVLDRVAPVPAPAALPEPEVTDAAGHIP